MRWKPTARALAAIKAGEYTELSIAFDEDIPNNVDGEGQGFGLWAVALSTRPFLDDMLPVAASRDTDPPPATSRHHVRVP
jgi:phage I-like protein